nr:hypothetical protein [Acidimicrobiia bacterium]
MGLLPLQVPPAVGDAWAWIAGVMALAVAALFAAVVKAWGAHLASETRRGDDFKEQAKAATGVGDKTVDVLRDTTNAVDRQRQAVADQVVELRTLRQTIAAQAAEMATLRQTVEVETRATRQVAEDTSRR